MHGGETGQVADATTFNLHVRYVNAPMGLSVQLNCNDAELLPQIRFDQADDNAYLHRVALMSS